MKKQTVWMRVKKYIPVSKLACRHDEYVTYEKVTAWYDSNTMLCVHRSTSNAKYWDVSDPRIGIRLNGDRAYGTKAEAVDNMQRYREKLDEWIMDMAHAHQYAMYMDELEDWVRAHAD